MYQEIYSLIVEFVYANAELTAYQELVATNLATIMAILMVAFPFCACLGVVKVVFK